jgi:hypothetical protein
MVQEQVRLWRIYRITPRSDGRSYLGVTCRTMSTHADPANGSSFEQVFSVEAPGVALQVQTWHGHSNGTESSASVALPTLLIR